MFPANTESVITMSESTGEFQAFINGMYNTQNLHATCLHLLEYINKKKKKDMYGDIFFFHFCKNGRYTNFNLLLSKSARIVSNIEQI